MQIVVIITFLLLAICTALIWRAHKAATVEREQRIRAEARLDEMRSTFVLCAEELGRQATAIQIKIPAVIRDQSGMEDFCRWAASLASKVNLLNHLYESHITAEPGKYRQLDLRALVERVAEEARSLGDVYLTIASKAPIPALVPHHELTQCLFWLIAHTFAQLPGRNIHIWLTASSGNGVLEFWSEERKSKKQNVSHKRVAFSRLEVHLARRTLQKMGAKFKVGESGEPYFTVIFPSKPESLFGRASEPIGGPQLGLQ